MDESKFSYESAPDGEAIGQQKARAQKGPTRLGRPLQDELCSEPYARKSRVTEVSTLTPGPIVEEKATDLT